MSQRWASLCYNLGVETKLLRHKRRKNVILYFRKSEILLFISHSLKTERPKLHTLAFYNMSQHLFIHRGLYTRIAFWWISTPQRSPRHFFFSDSRSERGQTGFYTGTSRRSLLLSFRHKTHRTFSEQH